MTTQHPTSIDANCHTCTNTRNVNGTQNLQVAMFAAPNPGTKTLEMSPEI